MPTIAEQISKNSTTPSSNIATALEGYNGGGGSGANAGGTMVVTVGDFEPTDDGDFMGTMDKTYDEIKQHYQSGGRLVFKIDAYKLFYDEPICVQMDEENDKITFVSIGEFEFTDGFEFILHSLVVASDLVMRCVFAEEKKLRI